MKNVHTLSPKWFALALGVVVGTATIGLVTPSDSAAQAGNEARRERRRDALQETFTGWDQLGTVRVSSPQSDQTVNVASGADPSDRIRVRVESASIVIERLVVTYVDGARYESGANLTFSNDHRTHEIDLPGSAKAIERVEFHTSNLPQGQATQVEVWSR